MRITLATWQALGDTIVSLPVAFHLEAQGHEVAVINTVGRCIAQRMQYIDHLPTYPRFASTPWGRTIQLREPDQPVDHVRGQIDEGPPMCVPVAYGRVIDLSAGPRFAWRGYRPLCDEIAAGAKMVLEDTPRVPILARPTDCRQRAAELTGSGAPYVLVAVEGSHRDRSLTEQQVAALASIARVVLVHGERREFGCSAVNLTGQTTLADLMCLTASALAVVSVDTGVWHMAPAFHTPLVGIVADTSNPLALAGYQPAVYLRTQSTIQAIPPQTIAAALERLIIQQPMQVAPRSPIGLRWWETAEVQTRLAVAETHQRALDRAFGCRVVEVA